MTDTPQEPAADVKGPGEKLHDSAVAFIIAGRVESVDIFKFVRDKIEGNPTDSDAAAIHEAYTIFAADGNALAVDLEAYIREKAEDITDKA